MPQNQATGGKQAKSANTKLIFINIGKQAVNTINKHACST